MTYTGYIRFISEDGKMALVEETESGADYFHRFAIINSPTGAFSSFSRGDENPDTRDADTINYVYNSYSVNSNGRDVTLT